MPKATINGDILLAGKVIGTLGEALTYCDNNDISVVPELHENSIWFHSAIPDCSESETCHKYLTRDENAWFGTPIEALTHRWAQDTGKLE